MSTNNQVIEKMNEKIRTEFHALPEFMRNEWQKVNKGIYVDKEAIRIHCWQCTSCSNERETLAIALCSKIGCVFHNYRPYRLNSRGVYDFYNPTEGVDNSFPKKRSNRKKPISPELSRKRREAALKRHQFKGKKMAA